MSSLALKNAGNGHVNSAGHRILVIRWDGQLNKEFIGECLWEDGGRTVKRVAVGYIRNVELVVEWL